MRLYLASRSPRRRELLHQIGIDFDTVVFRDGQRADSETDETPLPDEDPVLYVERVTRAKAEHGEVIVRERHLPPRPILAADTTLDVDGAIIGKPRAGETYPFGGPLLFEPGVLPAEVSLSWRRDAGGKAAAGLDYTHIPVPFDAPTLDHYRAFTAALETAETPVHVHCIMNWRVSAFLCRWHRDNGMADDAARAQMQLVWDPETSDYPNAEKWAAIAFGRE